jgi:septal ring-binding cell division protein DamX
MRRPAEREPEEADSEITLSATTLLGIFFGLVLICGVFFGFGYSTGRRGSETPSSTTPNATTPDTNPAPTASPTPKPSAMETLQAAGTTPQDPNTVTESLDEDSTTPATPSQPVATQMKQTPVNTASSKPSPVSTPAPEIKPASLPLPSAKPSGPPVMVQIAAVTRSEDANALASALRQRGYNVVVRNEPQDQLLHVQVGPFPSRDEAKLVRAKLMTDGYNPILKP